MNHIKSFLGFLYIVLTVMLSPLSAEAQTVTVPAGTNPSVQLLGQIFIETGNHVKTSRNIDNIENITEEITAKYADKIDPNDRLNDSDRNYISKCIMYFYEHILLYAFEFEGLDPDDPDTAQSFNHALTYMSKQVESKIAEADTVEDVVSVTETIFE